MLSTIRKRIIMWICITILLLFPLSDALAIQSSQEWKTLRNDKVHSGYSPAPGEMPRGPAFRWKQYLNDGSMGDLLHIDVNGNGKQDFIFIQGGSVVAYDHDFNLLWKTGVIGANGLVGSYNLGTDGTSKLVVLAGSTVYALKLADGETLWAKSFSSSSSISFAGLKVANLDSSKAGLELVLHVDTKLYAFAFDTGIASGYELWSITDTDLIDYPPEVTVGDMNNDGSLEVFYVTLGKVVVLNGATGSSLRQVNWVSGPDVNGRNYGLTVQTDIDSDSYLDTVIIADGVTEHSAVVNHDSGSSTLRWDKFHEYDYAVTGNNKVVKVTMDSVGDIDNDGTVEMTYAVFDDTGDGKWHTVIANAEATSYTLQQDLTDLYLWDVADLNGDGKKELLLSSETSSTVQNFSTLRVYAHNGTSYVQIGSIANSRFVLDNNAYYADNANSYARSSRTRVLKGDIDNDTKLEFFIENNDGTVKAYENTGSAISQKWSTTLGIPKLVANMDNDGANEVMLLQDGIASIYDSSLGSALSTLQLGGSTRLTPVAADIDNDGKLDVIVASDTKVTRFEVTTTTSTQKWRIDGFGLRAATAAYSALIDNMDGDANQEIVIGTYDGTTGESRVSVIDASGSEEWGKTFTGFFNSGPESGLYQWATGDFNGDGTKDIAAFLMSGGFDTEKTRIVDGSGAHSILWSKDVTDSGPRGFGPYPSYATVADTNNNGKDDIIMIAKDFLEIYDGSGTKLKEVQNTNDIYYDTPVWMDVTSGTTPEIILSGGLKTIGVLDNNGSTIWSVNIPNWDSTYRYYGIADVNEDGVKDVIVSRSNGTIEAYKGSDGTLEWSYKIGEKTRAGTMLTADIDLDGRPEIIFGTNDGRLIALNGGTDTQLANWKESRIVWQLDLGYSVGNPILADVDGDNQAELLVTVGDGYLYYFDTPGATVLLNDNFDAGTNGMLPSGWNENNSAYGDFETDNTVYAGASGKSGKMTDNTSNNYFVYRTFTPQTKQVIARWAGRPAQTSQTVRMQLADGNSTTDTSTWGPAIYFFSDGKIKYYDGNYHDLMTYSANQWYSFAVEADVTTDRYNLYINAQRVGEGLKFVNNNNLDKLDSIGFFGFNTDTPTLYIDNVLVYKYKQPLLDESFNYFDDNDLPPKWYKSNPGSGSVGLNSGTYQGTTGKSLKFEDNGNTMLSNFEIYTDFVPQSEGKVEIEYDVRLPSNTKTAYVFVSGTGGYWGPVLNFAADGKIKNYNSGWVNVMDYSANTWYHVRIVADAGAKTFDLDVDGVNKLTGAPFMQTGGTDIRYFAINTGTQDGSVVYIDNLKITKQ